MYRVFDLWGENDRKVDSRAVRPWMNKAASWTWTLGMVRLLCGDLVRSRPQFLGLIGTFFHCLFSHCPLPPLVLKQFLLLNQKAGALVAKGNFSFFQQIQEVAVRNVEHFTLTTSAASLVVRSFSSIAGKRKFDSGRTGRFRMNRRYPRLRSQFDPEGVGPLVKALVSPFPNRT
jgi:hypothetical protein